MNIRIGKTLIALAVLGTVSVPTASIANDNPALNHCVQLFVKEVVPAGRAVDIRHADIIASTQAVSATRSSVKLIARGEKNAKLFGRASCVIHRNGSLIAAYLYDSKPSSMGVSRPKVLARNVDARTAFADQTKPF
jgi:hypothetical protein